MNKIICEKCDEEMTVSINGVITFYTKAGKRRGDVFECPGCKARVISNLGEITKEHMDLVKVDDKTFIELDKK